MCLGGGDSCAQPPVFSWKITKRWQKPPFLVVNTHNRRDILSCLRGQGADSEERNKIDSQLRHIYLHYFHHHQASKFSWWHPREFIVVISMIHSYQMLNVLLAQSCCFLLQQNKQRGGMFFKPPRLKLQSEATSFTPKFGSDAFSSPPTSIPPVLCIHNDQTPEHLKLSSCKIRHKTKQWLCTRPSQIPVKPLSAVSSQRDLFKDYSYNRHRC